MCSRIGVTGFEICADAPAVAGPESASNMGTRTRDHLLKNAAKSVEFGRGLG